MNVKSKLVSIVIPTLNEREFIDDLVQSVCIQDYRPIELIFVDGGSRDTTIKRIREKITLMNSDEFSIKIYHEKDFGDARSPANARNIGVRMSKGDNIILLDGDTFFIESDTVNKIQEKLDTYDMIEVKTEIIIDTEQEHELVKIFPFNKHNYTRCGYVKRVFDTTFFNPSLGYGDDGDFWYRARRAVRTDFHKIDDTTIGMHLPHTRLEYLKQTIWYARSMSKYMKIVITEKRSIGHSGRYLKYCLYGALGPILFLLFGVRFLTSPIEGRRNIRFHLWNFIVRRYIFIYYFILGARKEKMLNVYIRLSARKIREALRV